jgi:hypothetical protein
LNLEYEDTIMRGHHEAQDMQKIQKNICASCPPYKDDRWHKEQSRYGKTFGKYYRTRRQASPTDPVLMIHPRK